MHPHKALLPTPNSRVFKTSPIHSSDTQVKPKTLTSAERAEKLAKGLCFFCDQPYEKRHRCNNKKTQLFLIEIPGEEDEEMAELVGETAEDIGEIEDDQPQISVYALSGRPNFQTMRVTGSMAKHLYIV